MSKLTIIARIKTKEDKVELVKSELLKVIDMTRKEEGCIQYDLHQDNENPSSLLFFENWESRDHWQAHMQSQHLRDYKLATQGAIEEVIISEMTQVG